MNITLINRIISVILALAWPVSSAMASSDLLFQNYSSANGLPNMGVCSFAQDNFGSVWVGTNDGICMFDGESFITPKIFQQEPFISASSMGICIDSHNVLWQTSKDGLLTCNLDTGESRLFKDYRASAILCDGDGAVWVKSSRGLVYYTHETEEWNSSFADEFNPVSICINSMGELCATASDGCIYIKKRGQNSFKRIPVLPEGILESGLTLVKIAACDERRLLYSTSDNSAYCLDLYSGCSKKFFDGHFDGKEAILSGIIARNPQQFWVTTDNGLFVYDDYRKTCTRYMHNNGNPYSLASSKLRCVFKDRQDRIWIGTFYDGLSQFIDTGADIRIYRLRPEDPEHSLKGKIVKSICAGDHGIVWTASENGYLEKIFPDGRIVSVNLNQNEHSKNNTYQSIAYSNGKVYAAELGGGLSVFDSESLKLLKKYDIGDNYCSKILLTTQNETLVGTSDGLFRLDSASDTFKRISSIPHGFVYTMYEDRNGNIWISLWGKGIYILSPYGDDVNVLEASGCEGVGFTKISDLCEDADGQILAASSGDGLLIFRPDKDMPWKVSCNRISKNDGLPSDKCSAVTQDKAGRIWVSTINGIASIENDVVTDVFQYEAVGNYFCSGSVLNSTDGMIYMGSSGGMISFNPEGSIERKHKLFLADITTAKDNSFTSISEKGHSPFTSKNIRVRSRETSSLTIRLVCLKTDVNEVLRFGYSLAGNNREIVNVSNEKQITYANLTPGKYLFTVNVNQDDSPEACVSLQIQVVPPFYSSLVAKFIYGICIAAIILLFVYFKISLINKDKERAIEVLESYKQKEIYESKINFFTNISNEIRTPLTLIKVPLDKIIESHSYLPSAEYDIRCIQKSTDKLLDITDQVLNFKKIEKDFASLSFSRTDLTKLVKEVYARTEELANQHSVILKKELPDDPVVIMCAPGSIEKIISNLLMNGIKYCHSEVSVVMEVLPEKIVRISVISDGTPIAEEERERIFEPFYQSERIHSRSSMNEGIGLGLSFAKSLANLHKGTLAVDPDYQDGNSFILELPAESGLEIEEYEEYYLLDEDQSVNTYSILIVESDATLNNYIKTELASKYTVYQTYDSKEALAVLNENNVNLIVSEINMPEMNGSEFVNVVKSTLKFSHIPIILLSAVADYDTLLEALRSGADGYITKPFSMQILRATIFNTLKNREILYERFSSSPFTRLENYASSQDDDFMANLYDYIMANISDTDFSVIDLADKMSTSRSTLYRKIKANTGLNINGYIRVCRLKKAAELLSTQKYQIKEVAYMVGFTTVSYFTKSFKKQFNISPSSLIKNN